MQNMQSFHDESTETESSWRLEKQQMLLFIGFGFYRFYRSAYGYLIFDTTID